MGYRVGSQCLADQPAADDYVLSALPPVLTAEGKLIRPERKPDGWYLNNTQIKLSYPECSPTEQIKEGAQIGGAFVLLLAVAYGLRLVLNFVRSLGSVGGSEE